MKEKLRGGELEEGCREQKAALYLMFSYKQLSLFSVSLLFSLWNTSWQTCPTRHKAVSLSSSWAPAAVEEKVRSFQTVQEMTLNYNYNLNVTESNYLQISHHTRAACCHFLKAGNLLFRLYFA